MHVSCDCSSDQLCLIYTNNLKDFENSVSIYKLALFLTSLNILKIKLSLLAIASYVATNIKHLAITDSNYLYVYVKKFLQQ